MSKLRRIGNASSAARKATLFARCKRSQASTGRIHCVKIPNVGHTEELMRRLLTDRSMDTHYTHFNEVFRMYGVSLENTDNDTFEAKGCHPLNPKCCVKSAGEIGAVCVVHVTRHVCDPRICGLKAVNVCDITGFVNDTPKLIYQPEFDESGKIVSSHDAPVYTKRAKSKILYAKHKIRPYLTAILIIIANNVDSECTQVDQTLVNLLFPMVIYILDLLEIQMTKVTTHKQYITCIVYMLAGGSPRDNVWFKWHVPQLKKIVCGHPNAILNIISPPNRKKRPPPSHLLVKKYHNVPQIYNIIKTNISSCCSVLAILKNVICHRQDRVGIALSLTRS